MCKIRVYDQHLFHSIKILITKILMSIVHKQKNGHKTLYSRINPIATWWKVYVDYDRPTFMGKNSQKLDANSRQWKLSEETGFSYMSEKSPSCFMGEKSEFSSENPLIYFLIINRSMKMTGRRSKFVKYYYSTWEGI